MREYYEVVYVGAPYGLNEYGETVSRHKTLQKAIDAKYNWEDKNPGRYYGSNTVVKFKGKVFSSGLWL